MFDDEYQDDCPICMEPLEEEEYLEGYGWVHAECYADVEDGHVSL